MTANTATVLMDDGDGEDVLVGLAVGQAGHRQRGDHRAVVGQNVPACAACVVLLELFASHQAACADREIGFQWRRGMSFFKVGGYMLLLKLITSAGLFRLSARLAVVIVLAALNSACVGDGAGPVGGLYRACVLNIYPAGSKGKFKPLEGIVEQVSRTHRYDLEKKCYVREWVFPDGLYHSLLMGPNKVLVMFRVPYPDRRYGDININVMVRPYWSLAREDFEGVVDIQKERLQQVDHGDGVLVPADASGVGLPERIREWSVEMVSRPDLYISGEMSKDGVLSERVHMHAAYARLDETYYVMYGIPHWLMPEYDEVNKRVLSVIETYLVTNSMN